MRRLTKTKPASPVAPEVERTSMVPTTTPAGLALPASASQLGNPERLGLTEGPGTGQPQRNTPRAVPATTKGYGQGATKAKAGGGLGPPWAKAKEDPKAPAEAKGEAAVAAAAAAMATADPKAAEEGGRTWKGEKDEVVEEDSRGGVSWRKVGGGEEGREKDGQKKAAWPLVSGEREA